MKKLLYLGMRCRLERSLKIERFRVNTGSCLFVRRAASTVLCVRRRSRYTKSTLVIAIAHIDHNSNISDIRSFSIHHESIARSRLPALRLLKPSNDFHCGISISRRYLRCMCTLVDRDSGLKHYTYSFIPRTQSGRLHTETMETISSSNAESKPPQRFSYPDLSTSSFACDSNPFSILRPSSALGEHDEGSDGGGPASRVEPQASSSTPSVPDPFRTPLGFHIPKDRLLASLSAPAGSEDSYWQYTLYKGPGAQDSPVKVHYCKNKEQMETVSQLFKNEQIIGLDLEWKAGVTAQEGIKRNVSLIQMANEERIALFHIARFAGQESADLVSPTFKEIMESPDILKAGVAIKGDCTRLRNHLDVHCRAQFELSYLYKLIKFHAGETVKMNRYCVGLAQQVQEYLQLPLLKGEVQTSDWWSKDLNLSQVRCRICFPIS